MLGNKQAEALAYACMQEALERRCDAVEHRMSDGFINATAMCRSQGKRINLWFQTQQTLDLVKALADDLGLEVKGWNISLCNAEDISRAYPDLVITRRGNPVNGGGTWLHPDLAIQLAQWCSPAFAIQVSRWVKEWLQAVPYYHTSTLVWYVYSFNVYRTSVLVH